MPFCRLQVARLWEAVGVPFNRSWVEARHLVRIPPPGPLPGRPSGAAFGRRCEAMERHAAHPARLALWTAIALVWSWASASAQAPPRAPQAARRPPSNAAAPPVAAAAPGGTGVGEVLPPPFQLTAPQQAALDQVLSGWEQRAQTIRTFKCTLRRWEFNDVFKTTTYTEGELRYRKPAEALYRVKPTGTEEWAEYWVSDGLAIFEFVASQKELVERRLPPEMQGQAIEDGPLPFVFSSNATKLKERYFLRLAQPPADRTHEIWLEAFPRRREDAANFQRAEMILDAQQMLPSAVRIHLPNGQDRTVHQFLDVVINDPLGFLKGDFAAPRAPRDWKRRIEDVVPVTAGAPPPPAPRAKLGPAPRQAAAPRPASQ